MTPTREFISPEKRRKSFLRLVHENGYHDGFYANDPRESAYLKDEEALTRYRIALRLGRLERSRRRHEV